MSSSTLGSSFHFGFPVSTPADLSNTAKLLKRRADAISTAAHAPTDCSHKALREKYSLYVLASIFWLEHASVLVAPEVSTCERCDHLQIFGLLLFLIQLVILSPANLIDAFICVSLPFLQKPPSNMSASAYQASVARRHDDARRMLSETATFLSFTPQLPQLQMPWMQFIFGRVKAICTYLAIHADLARIKRIKSSLNCTSSGAASGSVPTASIAVSAAAAKKDGKKAAASAKHETASVASTPPLTPASPASFSGGSSSSSGAQNSASVVLTATECAEISGVLRNMEALAEAKERWRTIWVNETNEITKITRSASNNAAPGASSAGAPSPALLSSLLPQLIGGGDINVEHLESNTSASVLVYAKRAMQAVAQLYSIPPFFQPPVIPPSLTI